MDKLLDDHHPGLRRLEAAINAVLPQPGEPAALALWMSLWDRAVRNPAFAREHRDYYRRWRIYVRRFLQDAIRLKEAHVRLNLDTATDLIVAGADGLWLAMTLEPRRFSKIQRQVLLRQLIDDVSKNRRRRAR